ncbi:MAG: SMP-30/gluconolactonase/LRE family protein [Cognatishimia sp.]
MTLSFKNFLLAGSFAVTVPAIAFADANITFPDLAFAPEGISNDASGNLYVGSLTQGRIVKIRPKSGEITDHVAAGSNGLVTVVGLHVAGDQTFVCSSDPGIGALTGSAAPALVAFDTKSGEPSGRYPLPEGGIFCNDIVELPDGTILATDSFVPRIYSLTPGADQLKVWLEDYRFSGEGFNLNGIAYDDGSVFVARYNKGTLHQIEVTADGQAGTVTDLEMSEGIQGADGLTALGDGRFLIVEGGGLSAGARGALWGATLSDGTVTLETIAPDLNVPTTATVVGSTAYVVEGQLDHLFNPEAGPADPYRILAVELPETFQPSLKGN